MTPHLKFERTTFAYAGRITPVLTSVDLIVKSGEMVGLIGPNGSGKSTLLKMALGQVVTAGARLKGNVEIHGQDAMRIKAMARAKLLAFVPQQLPAELPYTVGQVVSLGRHPHQSNRPWATMSEDGKRAFKAALERCSLTALEHMSFNTLSGGERQRTLIAAALAQQTPTVLLDEPTSALDVCFALKLMHQLRDKVSRENASVLIASHNLNLMARFCSRLVLLDGGKVIADGTPQDVMTEANMAQVYKIRAQISPDLGEYVGPFMLPLSPIETT